MKNEKNLHHYFKRLYLWIFISKRVKKIFM